MITHSSPSPRLPMSQPARWRSESRRTRRSTRSPFSRVRYVAPDTRWASLHIYENSACFLSVLDVQAIHLDPLGKSPRSGLFAEEGVRIAETKLGAREGAPAIAANAHLGHVLTRPSI